MASGIRWSPRAASDLEEICSRIAKDSTRYASYFAGKIISIVKAIPEFPKAGRAVPEYGDENLRERIYRNYRPLKTSPIVPRGTIGGKLLI